VAHVAPSIAVPPPAPISRPDSEIETIAVTLDGTAAVTIGQGGDSRLWPALDGTLEPRMLDLPASTTIAVASDPRGVAIAAIDSAGGLVLRVVDRTGSVLSHGTLGPDVAFTDVITTPRGFLVTRADQTLAFVSPDGTIGATLATESSQRIAAIAASTTDVALVQLDTDTGRGLRWLQLAPSLAWGEWVPTSIPPEGVIALSPSAAQIGMLVGPDSARATVIMDAKTGAVTMAVEDQRADEDDLVLPTEADVYLGYAEAPHTQQLTIKNRPEKRTRKPEPTRRQVRRVVAARGRAFTGQGFSVMSDGADGRTFLGYDMTEFDELVSAQNRAMVRTRFNMVEVGPDLHETAHLSYDNLVSVEYAGGTRWLIEINDQVHTATSIRLVDTASALDKTVWKTVGNGGHMLFEPASHLFSVSGARGVLGRVDADGEFQSLAELKTRGGEILFVPLDKSRANGVSAIAITQDAGHRIRWVTDPSDLTTGVTVQLMDGDPLAYDETGNVYVLMRSQGNNNLATYKDGTLRAQTVDDKLGPQLYVRGDGQRIARTTFADFSVTDAASHVLWTVQHGGFARIAWLEDGSLLAGSNAGIAHYNGETGERLALRCGLSFGLHHELPTRISSVPALCSAP
jgi:hypothetical protein